MGRLLRRWRVIWVILTRNLSFWGRCFSDRVRWGMRIVESQSFSFRKWSWSHRAGTFMGKEILVFTALENNCDTLCHSGSNRSFLVCLYGEGRVFGGQDDDTLRNWCSIDYFYDRSIRFLELVPCELDLRGVDLDESITCRFLKIIFIYFGIHFERSVLDNLLSVLRRRDPGTKVAFNSRPVLPSCSVIRCIT